VNAAITTTRPVTLGCCVACLLGQAHAVHDTSLPAAQRSAVTVPAPRRPADPDVPGFLTEPVPAYPAI